MKEEKSFWMTPQGITALGLIAIATYFLLIEHREHVLPFLPYLLMLACPMMHLFMHSGHHHGKNDQNDTSKDDSALSDVYHRGSDDALKKHHEHNHHS